MKIRFPRVLVIDDDQSFTQALCRWLAELGYAPVVATSAADGIARIEQESFDALLLDLQLPDIHGHAIIRQLNRAGLMLPVIVVSGTQEMDDVVRVWRENAADFLRKPVRFEELGAALDKALNAFPRETTSLTQGTHRLVPQAAPRPAPHDAAPALEAPLGAVQHPAGAHAAPPGAHAAPPVGAHAAAPTGAYAAPPPTSQQQGPPPARPQAGLRPHVAKFIEDLKSGIVKLPILDPKVVRLPDFLTNEKWTIDDLVDTVARDGNLAAAILRSANSAIRTSGKDITSLREACARLGSKAVVAIAFEIIVKNQFSAPAEPFRSLLKNAWRNSVITSQVAPLLGEMLQLKDRDELRIAALFHNVGEQLCLCLLSEIEGVQSAAPTAAQLASQVEALHEEMGMALARSWKLPPFVVRLAGRHHRAAIDPEPKDQARLRHLVLASWSMALRAGFTYFPGQESTDPAEHLAELGLEDAAVQPIYEKISTWSTEAQA